ARRRPPPKVQERRGRRGASFRRRQGALLMLLDAFGRREPGMRRAQPAVPLDLHPLRVIEGAHRDPAQVGARLERPGDDRTAARAELVPQPASGLVRAVLVGAQLAAQHLDILVLEVCADAERAAGALLAEGAVAGAAALGQVAGAVAHRAAETAAFMDFTH